MSGPVRLRDWAIYEDLRRGKTPREIGTAWGLTDMRIRQIGYAFGWRAPDPDGRYARVGRPHRNWVAHVRERDRLIREARIGGQTLQQIGDVWNLTRERVRQIVKRDQVAS